VVDDDGAKLFMTFAELRVEDLSAVWDLDTVSRDLRAHLVVEHFMNEALVAEGLDLQRFRDSKAWLTFSQKQKLLGKRGAMGVLGPAAFR
jgi:hypothetical protein